MKNKNPLNEKQKKYNVAGQGITILGERSETRWFCGNVMCENLS
jgi:hypothetical protein